MSDPKPGGLPSFRATIQSGEVMALAGIVYELARRPGENFMQPMSLDHLCALVSALDDEGKREVARAAGFAFRGVPVAELERHRAVVEWCIGFVERQGRDGEPVPWGLVPKLEAGGFLKDE